MVSPRCGISPLTSTPDREGHMAWNETTREKYKRSSDRYESDLTDEEWRVIGPLLPAPSKLGRHRTVDLRAVFDAIQYSHQDPLRARAAARPRPGEEPFARATPFLVRKRGPWHGWLQPAAGCRALRISLPSGSCLERACRNEPGEHRISRARVRRCFPTRHDAKSGPRILRC